MQEISPGRRQFILSSLGLSTAILTSACLSSEQTDTPLPSEAAHNFELLNMPEGYQLFQTISQFRRQWGAGLAHHQDIYQALENLASGHTHSNKIGAATDGWWSELRSAAAYAELDYARTVNLYPTDLHPVQQQALQEIILNIQLSFPVFRYLYPKTIMMTNQDISQQCNSENPLACTLPRTRPNEDFINMTTRLDGSLRTVVASFIHELGHNLSELELFPAAKASLAREAFFEYATEQHQILDSLCQAVVDMGEQEIHSFFSRVYTNWKDLEPVKEYMRLYALHVLQLREDDVTEYDIRGSVIYTAFAAQKDRSHPVWSTSMTAELHDILIPSFIEFFQHMLLSPRFDEFVYEAGSFSSVLEHHRVLHMYSLFKLASQGNIKDNSSFEQSLQACGVTKSLEEQYQKVVTQMLDNNQFETWKAEFGVTPMSEVQLAIPTRNYSCTFQWLPSRSQHKALLMLHFTDQTTLKTQDMVLDMQQSHLLKFLAELETGCSISAQEQYVDTLTFDDGTEIVLRWFPEDGQLKPWTVEFRQQGHQYVATNSFTNPEYMGLRPEQFAVQGVLLDFYPTVDDVRVYDGFKICPQRHKALCVPESYPYIQKMLMWEDAHTIVAHVEGKDTLTQYVHMELQMSGTQFIEKLLSVVTVQGLSQALLKLIADEETTVVLTLEQVRDAQYAYKIQVSSLLEEPLPEYVWFSERRP